MNVVKPTILKSHLRSLPYSSKPQVNVTKYFGPKLYSSSMPMGNVVSLKSHINLVLQQQFYSRRSRRERRETTTIEREEREEKGTKEIVPQEELEDYHRYEEEHPDVPAHELVTGSVAKYISKVYKTLLATTGAAVGGIIVPLIVPPLLALSPIMGFASLAGVLGIAFTSPEKLALRQNLLLFTGLSLGMAIAPAVAVSALFGPVILAAAGTAAIFAGFTLAALKARTSTFLKFGGLLYGGLFLVFGITVAMFLLPLLGVTLSPAVAAAMHNVWLYLGLAIFSGLIAYDTSAMIERARQGIEDHVSDALSLFLNLANIFIRLLHIFNNE